MVLAECSRLQSSAADVAPAPPVGKSLVPIPEKLRIEEFGDELTISWRWFSAAVLFLIPFAIAWNAFLIGWYTMAGSMPDQMPGAMRLIFLVFPLAHVAVGLGLIYGVVTMLVNRTTVRVRNGLLEVRHGPIYYPGSRSIPVDDVDQLYCTQQVDSGGKRGPTIKHPLHVQLKSGRTVPLLPGNTDADVARAVEQLVEKHLRIEGSRGRRRALA